MPNPKFFRSIVLENIKLFRRLVGSTAGLGDDTLELVDLLLGTAESTELIRVLACCTVKEIPGGGKYPLLSELTGTLVTGVAEQFNDAALVGGEAIQYVSIRFLVVEFSTLDKTQQQKC